MCLMRRQVDSNVETVVVRAMEEVLKKVADPAVVLPADLLREVDNRMRIADRRSLMVSQRG